MLTANTVSPDEGLTLIVEPEDDLSLLVNQQGKDIFANQRPEMLGRQGYSGAMVYSGPTLIGPGEEVTYVLGFGPLGTRDTTGLDHGVEALPDPETLRLIQSVALDAVLVVRVAGSIVAEFDLRDGHRIIGVDHAGRNEAIADEPDETALQEQKALAIKLRDPSLIPLCTERDRANKPKNPGPPSSMDPWQNLGCRGVPDRLVEGPRTGSGILQRSRIEVNRSE